MEAVLSYRYLTSAEILGSGSIIAITVNGDFRGGLRDRALIGVMVYAFARVSAVVSLKVEDYFPLQKRWWLRLREKGGKVNEMGCHHKLEQYLDEYIAAAGITQDKKGPLFRAPLAGRASCPSGPCRASMHGTWCVDERGMRASRRQ
jgi:site-specific recombinase XerC